MHHTISDSCIQPTHRTSKSSPKFLPENHDENVCQPLCIGSWAEPASWSPKHTSSGSRDIPLSPQISTARHTSSVLKSLKTQSDKITSKGKLNPLQESGGGENIIRSNYNSKARDTSRLCHRENMRERDQTHSYWYIPSTPRVNYSLLVMESVGMMKMATDEGPPPLRQGAGTGSRLVFGGYKGLQWRNSRSILFFDVFRVYGNI